MPPEIADYLRDEALADADILFPNRFELAYLSGRTLQTPAEVIAGARSLLQYGPKLVICTSANILDSRATEIETMAVTGEEAWTARAPRLQDVPKGSGDLLAALYVANHLTGNEIAAALQRTVSSVQGILKMSVDMGRDELALVAAQSEVSDPVVKVTLERLF